MTRIVLRVGGLLAACLLGVFASRILGLDWWVAAPAAAAWWLILSGSAGLLRARVTVYRLRHEGPNGRTARALCAVAALEDVATGAAGFTVTSGRLAVLEHVVFLGPALGPRRGAVRDRLGAAIRSEIQRSTPRARADVIAGLVAVVDAAERALSAPLDALYLSAPTILARLRMDTRRPITSARLAAILSRRDAVVLAESRSWSRRRALYDPRHPEQALAVRLLAAGFGKAALDVLRLAPEGGRVDRLRRLARSCSLLADADSRGLLSLPPAVVARWHAELLLLAGRRLPDLSPDSQLMKIVPGGAATLERAVARTPIAVAEFAELARSYPELQRSIATVVARIVGWPIGSVVTAMRERTLSARPDAALRSHLRGLALIEERRASEAAAEFEAALSQAPDFAQAAFALATMRRQAGDAAGGESVLRALVDRRATEPEPLLFLARYLSAIGERERARAAFESGVRRFPEYVPLRVAFAQELVAWGCGAEAATQLDAARRDHPDEPRLALMAGRTLAAESRLDDAARALEKAARGLSGRERAEAWFWLMGVRREQGDHTTAERIARRLIGALGAGQTSQLDDVADYLEERHDFLRAREAAERARRLRGSGDGAF